MKNYRIAVLGSTGVVGLCEMIRLIEAGKEDTGGACTAGQRAQRGKHDQSSTG